MVQPVQRGGHQDDYRCHDRDHSTQLLSVDFAQCNGQQLMDQQKRQKQRGGERTGSEKILS